MPRCARWRRDGAAEADAAARRAVCYDDVGVGGVVLLSCMHRLCCTCAAQYVVSKMGDGQARVRGRDAGGGGTPLTQAHRR